jgi:hypothetical protein
MRRAVRDVRRRPQLVEAGAAAGVLLLALVVRAHVANERIAFTRTHVLALQIFTEFVFVQTLARARFTTTVATSVCAAPPTRPARAARHNRGESRAAACAWPNTADAWLDPVLRVQHSPPDSVAPHTTNLPTSLIVARASMLDGGRVLKTAHTRRHRLALLQQCHLSRSVDDRLDACRRHERGRQRRLRNRGDALWPHCGL